MFCISTLQSCTVRMTLESLRDKAGVAIADALKQNSTLQSFSIVFFSNSSEPGDAEHFTGVAVADAIKHHKSLKSFSIHANFTRIKDGAGLAFAEALKENW